MLNKYLRLLFQFLVVLLLLSATTPRTIHSFHMEVWLWITTIISGILLGGRIWLQWQRRATIATVVILVPVFSLFKLAVVWRGDWMTQNILFEHRTWPGRAIEFQMMNPGPGTYYQRTIERQRLLPGLEWLHEIDARRVDTIKWKRINKEINELKIKYAWRRQLPCNIMALCNTGRSWAKQRP